MRRGVIRSVPDLVRQILDTMQNWRDTLQAELPGFSDRIAHIELQPDEGGMNITMPETAIQRVDDKGRLAGQQLTAFDFRRHWVDRYLSLMRELQTNLRGDMPTGRDSSVLSAFPKELATWLRSGTADSDYRIGLGDDWFEAAVDATEDLLADAVAWLGAPDRSFASRVPPKPVGIMRMTPDV